MLLRELPVREGKAVVSDLEREAMQAATVAVRKILAQSKNPRTVLGRMSPSSVAFHAAWEAIRVHDAYLDARTTLRGDRS